MIQIKKTHLLFLLISGMVLTGCEISFPSSIVSNPSLSEIISSVESSETTLISSDATSENLTSGFSSTASSPTTIPSSVGGSTSTTTSTASSSSTTSPSSSSSSPTPSSTPSVSSSANAVTIASNAPNYYQNISPSATGQSLKNALKTLISTSISVSYDWSRFQSADESLTETNKVLTIYPRRNYLKTATANNGNDTAPAHWNREHTYPKSKIGGNAESDNHHIFADDWKTNGERSNLRYGDVPNTESNRVKDSSNLPTNNFKAALVVNGEEFFEPNDLAKGEVARATLYLNTLYGYAINGNFQSDEQAVLWALEYPISNRDMQRNNRVYTNQKNRNPYIDRPEWICAVYGTTSTATRAKCGL